MSVLKARSPAKLILSGEHAVVYGHKALALAVNCYAESSVFVRDDSDIFFNFLNLEYAKSYTLQALRNVKHRLSEQYEQFLSGQGSIQDVLKKPFELLQFTVGSLLEKGASAIPQGFEIRTASNIPLGCGMGSSAATIMSVLMALSHFLKLDMNHQDLLKLGKEAENLQHGYSSGLDLQTTFHGGYLNVKENKIERKEAFSHPFTLVHTGKPETSTGHCVMSVAPFFKETSIGEEFESVTQAMDEALTQKNEQSLHQTIRENHRLLKKIGVVPEKVAAFIQAIEDRSGSAKICGAGAVEGDSAGMVWVNCVEDISDLVQHYGYNLQAVLGDGHGTRLL